VTKPRVGRTLDEMADWIRNLRDAGDILRRAKNPAELAKALVPNAWLTRRVINLDAPRSSGPVSAADAAEALRKLGNALKSEVIGADGQVDYAKLQSSETFAELERTSSLLHHVDPEQLTEDDARIAFWINVYNVLAIHGVVATGVRESVMEIPSFFGVVAYRVGDFVVTLDEIENGILRRNAPHPATKSRLFDDDDPRLALCPSYVDPRIHAALVCASTSCPPVAFYEAGRLDEQLDLAAENYVATDVEVDDSAKLIRLPITFRYYESDFGRRAGVQLFLLKHAAGPQRQALRAAFDAGYALDYHRYDWSLNAMA
jgi:hypothetical protein